MEIESPLPTYVAYEVSYIDDRKLIDWAVAYLPTSEYFEDDSDLIELVSINAKNKREVEKAGIYLSRFIDKQWPEFNLNNKKAEQYAKRYFRKRMKQYLAGECSPYDVCKMISPIEQIFNFPDWLGNMYNACDWIEPKSQPSDCRHLEAEVEQTLKL